MPPSNRLVMGRVTISQMEGVHRTDRIIPSTTMSRGATAPFTGSKEKQSFNARCEPTTATK